MTLYKIFLLGIGIGVGMIIVCGIIGMVGSMITIKGDTKKEYKEYISPDNDYD